MFTEVASTHTEPPLLHRLSLEGVLFELFAAPKTNLASWIPGGFLAFVVEANQEANTMMNSGIWNGCLGNEWRRRIRPIPLRESGTSAVGSCSECWR